jgi:DNA-binding NtrC family response regulator
MTSATEAVNPAQNARPIRVVCVEQGNALAGQVKRVLADRHALVDRVRYIDAVLDRLERERVDVLLLASSALSGREVETMEIVELITTNSPSTQLLFLVTPREMEVAGQALRSGSHYYAKLPVTDDELKILIDTAIERQPETAADFMRHDGSVPAAFNQMIGASPAMQEVYRQVRKAATTDIPVLLAGETGTGKDLAAQAIHEESRRKEKTYYPIHLGALPSELVASELFGHERGAFTGATERRPGCFEQADGGTVFLDEISTIDERIQISLLRLLETQEFYRIGGQDAFSADVRVIAASNEDIQQCVREGRFREDLFFRLEVLQVTLPPLRERHGDIPLLIDFFLKSYNQSFRKGIRGVSPDFMAQLEAYPWPGNVRELKNVIQRAVVMCSGDLLLPEHLPRRLLDAAPARPSVSVPIGTTLVEMERELIVRTLDYTGNNRRRAAAMLDISRRTLYNKIARYGL